MEIAWYIIVTRLKIGNLGPLYKRCVVRGLSHCSCYHRDVLDTDNEEVPKLEGMYDILDYPSKTSLWNVEQLQKFLKSVNVPTEK